MEKEKLNIYIASNVGVDYFFFLQETISTLGYNVVPFYFVSEKKYRLYSNAGVLKRFYLRLLMYVGYPINLAFSVLVSSKNSIFIVTSNTFFTPWLIRTAFLWKNIKVIHLVYDLFPDALEIAGKVKLNSYTSKCIGLITRYAFSKCHGTVFLGKYLSDHAQNRWGLCRISEVIDISANLSLYNNTYVSAPSIGKIIVHYGGQLGYLHSPDDLIDSIRFVCTSDISDKIEFVFYVSGVNAGYLEKSLIGYPVRIEKAISSEQWRKDILNFHIGLVSLSPGGSSVCLPSKTYGMMAGGLAILAIAPSWSDLSNLIETNNCGWVINNSDCQKKSNLVSQESVEINKSRNSNDVAVDFYNTLNQIIQNPVQLENKRINAFNSMRDKYDVDTLGKKWNELILRI